MLCNRCSKLAILNTKKSCMNCKGTVLNNISVLCEACSNSKNSCSACLKKIYTNYNSPIYKHLKGGCRSCGR